MIITVPGKRIGRPRKEETKVIRLPVEIADRLKAMSESELSDFCSKKWATYKRESKKETKVIRLPAKAADRIKQIPEEELFDFFSTKQITFDFDEQALNQTDYHICTTTETPFEVKDFPLSDTPYLAKTPETVKTSESNGNLSKVMEVLNKWNKFMADSKNPNQPRLKKVTELLGELNGALKKA